MQKLNFNKSLHEEFRILFILMKLFNDFYDYSTRPPLALSLGMFDGVHKGHQSIIHHLTTVAQNRNLQSSILSFWPHPRLVFNPQEDLKLLSTRTEKTELLEKFGIQNLFLKEFDEVFRNLTGEEFVRQILVERLNVKYLTVGYDHVFGKGRSGDFHLLQKLAPELGFEVEKMEAVNLHNHNISSTKIRSALENGNITEANAMLGYSYPISGKVIHGAKLGRTIGYPTANLEVAPYKLLPKNGAYITEVIINGEKYQGMASIGTNPTVNGQKLSTEVYILNFERDIYDAHITLHFREFLHEEIKFPSVEKLIEKLDEDKKLTEQFQF